MIHPPLWQSLLFVPLGADKLLASALRHRPDAVILDLEDAVAEDAKPAARAGLRSAQMALAAAHIPCVLRVNGGLAAMVADLGSADHTLLHGVMIPKCQDTRTLRNAAELTDGMVGLIALIESPAALPQLPDIAAVPQVMALMLGSEDYSTTLGTDPNRGALVLPVSMIAAAATARGLLPIGFPGSLANFRDLDLYGTQLAMGRDLGMRAAAAIHPAQLPAIRAAFGPSPADILWATAILAKAQTSSSVFAHEGAMVDAPVIARARQIIAAVRPFSHP